MLTSRLIHRCWCLICGCGAISSSLSSLTWSNSSTAKASSSLMVHILVRSTGSESVAALVMFGTNLKIEQGLKVRTMTSLLHYKPQDGTYVESPTSRQCCIIVKTVVKMVDGLSNILLGWLWWCLEPIWKLNRDLKLGKWPHDRIINHKKMELT